MVCLQETKLGDALYNPGLNYEFYKMCPADGERAHGGVAIVVSKSVQHSFIPLTSNLQAVAIRAFLDREITICSIYLPPRSAVSLADLQALLRQLPPPFLLLGDFNAHNPLWGGTTLDTEGRAVDDFIHVNDLSLFNDGTMTFHNVSTDTHSAIDLTISSPDIHLNYLWSVNEHLHGSDHFPIHLKFARNVPSEAPIKWKETEADWEKFQRGVMLSRELESFESHLAAYDYFTSEVLDSAYASIPQTKGKPRRPPVPLWDKTCGVLRKVTRT